MKIFRKHLILTAAVTILFGILITACSSDNDYISQHQGVWRGTYTGNEDQGRWELTVDQKGNITGILTSDIVVQTFQLGGKVKKDGKLNLAIGNVSSGASFSGEMLEDSASGVWSIESENLHGEWRGTRVQMP